MTVEQSQFVRSQFCASNTCVEIAIAEQEVLVRDSKSGKHLAFDAEEWTAFVRGVKKGQFDL